MDTHSLLALGGILIVGFAIIVLINSLVAKKNQVSYALSAIDAQLKKRFDLIPNLVAICEKHMGHEAGVLKELAQSRERYLSSSSLTDGELSGQLQRFMAVAESHPTLRSSDNFLQFQHALNEVEEQLAAARRTFNATITDYNNACQQFPSNVVARCMGYKEKAWFEAEAEERLAMKVWR